MPRLTSPSATTTTAKASPPLALHRTFARMLRAAGTQAPALRRSLWLSAAAAVAQGLAFACLYPLLAAVLRAPPDAATAWGWLAALGVCALADWGLRWRAHGFEYSHRLADVTHELRLRLGEQLRRMPMEQLASRRSGELSATLAGNVDEVITPMGTVAALILRALLTPAVALLATACIDLPLALAMLLLVPLALPLQRLRRRLGADALRRLARAHARSATELFDYLQGLPVLRATGRTGARAAKLRRALAHLRRVQRHAQARQTWPGVLSHSVVDIGLLAILALGVWRVSGGALDVAALAAWLVIAVRVAEPLALLGGLTSVFDYMEAGLARIEHLLAVPALPQHTPARFPERFDVRFEGVDFHYAGHDEAVLRGFDAHFPARRMSALVGRSGAGKSTVARLLTRHADPQHGRVSIGGVDVRAIPPAHLNALVAEVFQDVHLFDDTLLANLRMARPGASDAEVQAAARAAHCHDFITRLPDGYLTRAGDLGGRLSGGERQRISIARAILKDAPIVVLDEPTAALDSDSERAVQRAIDALVRDKTVIVIAHRLSTIAGADRILVIDDGRVTEHGQHAALLAAHGPYHALWQAQRAAKTWHSAPDDAGLAV